MKKINYLFGFLMIVIFSCSQQDDNATSVSSKSFETTLSKNSIDVSKYRNPMSLEGNIKVWVNQNNELVAYSETETHIHIFLLQHLQSKINFKGDYEKIAFLDHSFSLVSDSGKNILCEVKDKDESIIAGNDLKQISGISNFETIVGGGVVHIWLDKHEVEGLNLEITYGKIKLKNSVYDAFDEGSDPLERQECYSGGVGANSCSVTGCSVSCGSGYYACCKNATSLSVARCGCVPNVTVLD